MIENFIQAGIVNPKDLKTLRNLAESVGIRIIFIDSTFVLPTSKENVFENYKTERIPNARFFSIESVTDTESCLPHTLPSKSVFEEAMSNLQIKNTDIIITYGQHGMIMGPTRLWWMLKGFGHKNVLVLNGGLPAWKAEGNKTSTTCPKEFNKTTYVAQTFEKESLITLDQMIEISATKSNTVIDARPHNRFTGKTEEPRPNMRSGHIPSSINVPCSQIVNADGTLKNAPELKKLLLNAGLDLTNNNDKIITTCGSGITACALMLALHHLGHNNTAVYDGSWSEWGANNTKTKVTKSK